jgi:protein-tyrosine phosphatase
MSGRRPDRSAFAVLFVCTGNICRSPLAEQVLQARADSVARDRFGLADASQWVTFASAGTWAREGEAMTDQAAELSVRYGGNPTGHAAKALTRELVDSADLVLGFTREHRREIVTSSPRASRLTFTLNEFVRLFDSLSADPAATAELQEQSGSLYFLEELVASVASRRGFSPPADPALDDIVDPYRQSQKTYEQAATAIVSAIDQILDSLGSVIEPKNR